MLITDKLKDNKKEPFLRYKKNVKMKKTSPVGVREYAEWRCFFKAGKNKNYEKLYCCGLPLCKDFLTSRIL